MKRLTPIELLASFVTRARDEPALAIYVDELVRKARSGRSLSLAEAVVVDAANGWDEEEQAA